MFNTSFIFIFNFTIAYFTVFPEIFICALKMTKSGEALIVAEPLTEIVLSVQHRYDVELGDAYIDLMG